MRTERTKGQVLALILGIMSGIPGLLLLLFTVQNYFGASSESETGAANAFLLVSGLPSIILIIVSILLIRFARRKQPG